MFVYDLVSIHNEKENQFLVSLLREEDADLRFHYNFPWIGLNTKIENNWDRAEWTDNSPFDFQAWSTNEPSHTKVIVTQIIDKT